MSSQESDITEWLIQTYTNTPNANTSNTKLLFFLACLPGIFKFKSDIQYTHLCFQLEEEKQILMGLTVGVIIYLFQSCVKSTEFYHLYNYLSSICIYQSVFSWAHFPKYNSLFMMISTNILFIIWCLIFFTNQFYSNTVLFFQMLHIDNCTWFWNDWTFRYVISECCWLIQ